MTAGFTTARGGAAQGLGGDGGALRSTGAKKESRPQKRAVECYSGLTRVGAETGRTVYKSSDFV